MIKRFILLIPHVICFKQVDTSIQFDSIEMQVFYWKFHKAMSFTYCTEMVGGKEPSKTSICKFKEYKTFSGVTNKDMRHINE